MRICFAIVIEKTTINATLLIKSDNLRTLGTLESYYDLESCRSEIGMQTEITEFLEVV